MEKKMKVLFLDGDNEVFAHVILNESQIKLLHYLYDNECVFEGFKYNVEDDDTEWEEI